jgi:hypothetical protein
MLPCLPGRFGITVCRADGTLRLPVLRREDLDKSFMTQSQVPRNRR